MHMCTLYTLALARTKTKQKRMDYSIKTSFFGSYSLWHKLNLVCHRTLTEQVRILRTEWSTQSSWPSKSRKSYSIIIILSWMRERSTVYTFFFHRNFWVRIFENIDFLLCLKRKWVKGFFTICFFFEIFEIRATKIFSLIHVGAVCGSTVREVARTVIHSKCANRRI